MIEAYVQDLFLLPVAFGALYIKCMSISCREMVFNVETTEKRKEKRERKKGKKRKKLEFFNLLL